MKDWTGNSNSIFKTLGASNHTDSEREQHDYYATEPKAVELLLEQESFCPYVWEFPAFFQFKAFQTFIVKPFNRAF